MRTYYAINYKDPGETAWIWTGSTTETREEAQRLIVQLRQANKGVSYQIEPVQ